MTTVTQTRTINRRPAAAEQAKATATHHISHGTETVHGDTYAATRSGYRTHEATSTAAAGDFAEVSDWATHRETVDALAQPGYQALDHKCVRAVARQGA